MAEANYTPEEVTKLKTESLKLWKWLLIQNWALILSI